MSAGSAETTSDVTRRATAGSWRPYRTERGPAQSLSLFRRGLLLELPHRQPPNDVTDREYQDRHDHNSAQGDLGLVLALRAVAVWGVFAATDFPHGQPVHVGSQQSAPGPTAVSVAMVTRCPSAECRMSKHA